MRYFKKITISLIGCLLIANAWMACNTDDDVTDTVKQEDLGDATLNQFIITADEELLVTVDATTGSLQPIYGFGGANRIIGLPTYHNGTAYVATRDNSINAIDVTSQQLRWSIPMLVQDPQSLEDAVVAYSDNMVYSLGKSGTLVVMDASTGSIMWTYVANPGGAGEGFFAGGESIVKGDLLYVLTEEHLSNPLSSGHPPYLHILDKKTGDRLRRIEIPSEYTGAIKFAGDIILLPAGDLYALNAETLDILWRVEFDAVSTPAVSGDKAIVHAEPKNSSESSSLIYGIDLNTGAIQWEQDAGFSFVQPPTVEGNIVFAIKQEVRYVAGRQNGSLMALQVSTGETIWVREDISVYAAPVFANGRLYFHGAGIRLNETGDDHGLFSINAADGEIIWLSNTFENRNRRDSPIIIADNGLFGRNPYYEK